MPRVKHPSGMLLKIPFDPRSIADLLFNNYEVLPDEDTPPELIAEHNDLIKNELMLLWKRHPGGRTIPGRENLKGPAIAPDTGIERVPGEGYSKPGLDWATDHKTFQPNPIRNYTIDQIEPFSKFDRLLVQAPVQQTPGQPQIPGQGGVDPLNPLAPSGVVPTDPPAPTGLRAYQLKKMKNLPV